MPLYRKPAATSGNPNPEPVVLTDANVLEFKASLGLADVSASRITAVEQAASAAAAAAEEALANAVAAPATAPASNAIVLDAMHRVYDPLTVTGATTITVSGTMKGARAQMVVIANGTNVPAITGATEWGTSFGYLNTAGEANLLDVEHNGHAAIFVWSQSAAGAVAAPAPPAPTPPAPAPPAVPGPVVSLAAGTPTASTIPLTWSAPATGGAPTDYVIQYAAAGTSFASPTTFADGTSTATGATITGLPASTALDVRVAALNGTGTGSYSSVLNVSTAAAPTGGQAGTPVTFASTQFLTDLGNEIYEATSSGTSYGARGVAAGTAAGDCFIEAQYPASGTTSTIFGLDSGTAVQRPHDQIDFCTQLGSAGTVTQASNNMTFSATLTTLSPSATTRVGLRRVGTVVTLETTTDDWATSTVRHTYAAASSGPLSAHYYTVFSTTARRICQPRVTGFA